MTTKKLEVIGGDVQETETHESFGQLYFARTQGGHRNLYGSSIPHQSTIRMEVRHSEKKRHLNRDWFHPTGTIVEIEMSQSQFAEAITSLNSGSGTPVTIRYIKGQRMEDCPEENKRMLFEREFEERMGNLTDRLAKLTEDAKTILSSAKPPTKGDKQSILSQIERLEMELRSNVPFVARSFNEQMDKTVTEAKGEIEAFTANRMLAMTIDGLERQATLPPAVSWYKPSEAIEAKFDIGVVDA